MDRRNFLKTTAAAAALAGMPEILKGADKADTPASAPEASHSERLIDSEPMLQNFAETSIGIAFSVTDMANGYVLIADNPDMTGARKVKCGGYRLTDMNSDVMLVRITGLKPSTRYWYRIGADRISYGGGYKMKIVGNEEPDRVYSFVTAGRGTKSHFCVINDTHDKTPTLERLTRKIAELDPACVIWNGDASNTQETVESQKKLFLRPEISIKDYAAERPYLFCPGNHDNRGLANRHLERIWMYRQNEERSSRDWDLGRNFAVRVGDIALIGLDTAEDKVDENPKFAGLFNSHEYRKAQTLWLRDALKKKEIASAPHKVALCHIPIFDSRPDRNPGNVHPSDTDPKYTTTYAHWQKDCGDMWGPLLKKAGCRIIICAHQHQYRFEPFDKERGWAVLTGGGWRLDKKKGSATLIEGLTEGRNLKIRVYSMFSGEILDEYTF